jgi:oligopeptide transport system ATP-binding protein
MNFPTQSGTSGNRVNGSVLLEAQNLKKHFPVTKGLLLSRVTGWIKAVDGVSFQIRPGKTLGLVGESGCGKSTTAKMLLMLEQPTEGSIFFRGEDIYKSNADKRKEYRSSVQAVFQDPWSSLNPRMRVKDLIAEPIHQLAAFPQRGTRPGGQVAAGCGTKLLSRQSVPP